MARIHPRSAWLARPRAPNPSLTAVPGSVSGAAWVVGAAECPGPLCPARALPTSGRPRGPPRGTLLPLRSSYGPMRQSHHLSPPSLTSCVESLQVAAIPCWSWDLPDIIPESLWRRLDPYPAVSPGCIHPFLPRGCRPHVTGKTFGTRDDPCDATSTGSRISGLQSFTDVQSPPLARPPGRTHRDARRHRAAGPFTPRIARRVTPSGMWHRYVTDLGNCHG